MQDSIYHVTSHLIHNFRTKTLKFAIRKRDELIDVKAYQGGLHI